MPDERTPCCFVFLIPTYCTDEPKKKLLFSGMVDNSLIKNLPELFVPVTKPFI